MKFQDWLFVARNELINSNNPKRDAEILLEYVTGKCRAFIYAFGEKKLTLNEIDKLSVLLARRKKGEPIAYITGECEFWSLPLYVSPVTLIPRPETECLVEQALLRLPIEPCRILDLGTGTGAIALALAKERPDCNITAVDYITDAIELAQRNIIRLKLNNVCVKKSNWFDALKGKFYRLIVSNPPYVDEKDLHLIQGEVRFEPHTSLIASNSGIADLDHIITQSGQYLNSGGWLLVEHGWKQGEKVRKIFIKNKYHSVVTHLDYSGNERLTLGCIY